mmetsp:Transcript_7760/g.11309  ORF Transcript_7760/g.11309 Transcript_7760/m.11309 type:complete len:190 (+) Transcript_7760:223-792(+)|eukprot:CAMPEP_0195529504 /NCGR_PEP_ID=MMETSP0794_2-20130614/32083_1 /TAXON_ID=515487 /ORGANISM="Stephanopyxis turris, Strain CCMP 815" /LENGTH=189 /DNA_ID=CAMNT_0040660821 /DNA_START=216 /DNA_END=785 /DNA_ORIENTATION=-
MGDTTPKMQQFAEALTSINAADVILGNSPSKENVRPIDPATWMQDFDRSTARPSTSRKVSCPTPNQRDDYVAKSPQPQSQYPRTKWDRAHRYSFDDTTSGTESEGDLVAEDLSVDTLRAIMAVIKNVRNSSDEILKTYTRHQVIVALLMATNMAFQLSPQQRIAIKLSVVMGRIAAAIANFRDATRAAA